MNSVASTASRPPPSYYGVPVAANQFAPGAPVLVNPRNIRRGMQVYDYDGRHVGFVVDVLEMTVMVRRGRRTDLGIPLEHVMAVLDDRVVLTVSAATM